MPVPTPQQPHFPTPQENAEAALGWPLYVDGSQYPEGRLDHLDGEMAHIALTALEGFIRRRTKQETVAQALGQTISEQQRHAFSLGEADKVLLHQELRGERRRLQILQGIAAYAEDCASGKKVTALRGYQEDVVARRLYNFVNSGRASDDLEKACGFYMPTGTGKTATYIHITEAVKYREDPKDPIRVLNIVPTIDLTEQTLKEYQRFTPHLDVGVYRGGKHQLGRQVVKITRESFNRLVESGKLDPDAFDVLIVDEVQEMLGERTEPNIKAYGRDKLVVATTATPDRTATVTAKAMFANL